VEKLDSQMVSLQQNAVSFAANVKSTERKKIEAVQSGQDFPTEKIDEMIDSFTSAATSTITTTTNQESEIKK
jgi:hypothetical protein